MGAAMQAQGHAQMVVRTIDYGQNPQSASDAKRWFLGEDQLVYFEDGFDRTVIEQLVARGHRIAANAPGFGCGGAQLIYKQANGIYVAGSDHRKDGQAVGY